MKQFLITLAAVFIGGFLALLGYDRFIVKPREAAAAEAKAAAEAATPAQEAVRPDVDLSQARDEAKQVAVELEASVQRSVENARKTMEAQAGAMDRRELIADAVRRATMFRVSVTEYYLSNGRWPRDAEDAGLPPSEDFSSGAVRSIAIGKQGAVEIGFGAPFADGSRVVLRPTAKSSGMVDWRCEYTGDSQIKQALPHCQESR